ncbi:MAG: response regulator transcription factor [Clostridia bacterium]|nr:response regulator transcription factor [Clostridia bacterium]
MIFCVEDDSSVRELMIYTLNTSGFDALGLEDAQAFWNALSERTPRLILLDIMLPGENGISILKKLRQTPATASIPVILATAKSTEYDKVIGLDMGADDYLTKPFGMMEMISRVKAVLRRTSPRNDANLLRLGELEMNVGEHTVLSAGERVQLTLKEYELLYTFLKNPRRVFTRDQLLSTVWGADFIGETRTVDVHIGTLRTKLGKCGAYVETVRGVGYRLEEKE